MANAPTKPSAWAHKPQASGKPAAMPRHVTTAPASNPRSGAPRGKAEGS